MPSLWVLAAVIVPTVAVAFLVRSVTGKFDAILLMLSGAASLVLAVVATGSAQVDQTGGMMSLEMSKSSFHFGVLPPVFIVATLTVMRGLFKFIQE
ncbi:hypothetical protein EN828_31805 [Mesorhizobium sp. M2D.F.Ca.ET.185.01.1.1]|jgi:hypothetical protein|uniref:Uncharacterized protein n=1 Tax=Mesorhizobium atlanticum TaxID=2233532 RepID=A0A330GWR4_9HYPH|nr:MULTISPECIES: hypothetical protein [Mesorhizobium]TGP72902.1 hypothetical protein EN870_31770 [bacterium M00.F.Ca.ET.227.01.1.1]TGP86580.1 hypothetical protein EN864_25195 [bacterium M00.F.Ca.ET.221.01.1.1]TGP87679.1 hypothetical protein EN865_29705 [bacterium M00.F.Ca.ET.222.01.1.1]TGU08052.1 hypothetical protein EN806_32470 [bacterium M00.F.Ca.ET.163.01.1.1]TGU33731.1 hypothetical protein EN799_22410 [bacterium M00.F.Ca.ET.156.01.1.1]TGU42731.1 hypothetical protein EN789_31745 [bacterium